MAYRDVEKRRAWGKKRYWAERSEHSLAKARSKASEYYRKNRAKVLSKIDNPDVVSASRIRAKRNLSFWKAEVFRRLGKKCIRCGFNDERALQFDHINGGGTSGAKGLNRQSYYRFLALSPELKKEIQILCANCNWIKRAENNEATQWKIGSIIFTTISDPAAYHMDRSEPGSVEEDALAGG